MDGFGDTLIPRRVALALTSIEQAGIVQLGRTPTGRGKQGSNPYLK